MVMVCTASFGASPCGEVRRKVAPRSWLLKASILPLWATAARIGVSLRWLS
jgi:hypothetical protein